MTHDVRLWPRAAAVGLAVVLCLIGARAGTFALTQAPAVNPADGIHKIKHIVIIMQENRSFDSYFGTYPGADGIPMRGGVPSVCVPDPGHGGCQRPYHDASDLNHGGPHGANSARADVNAGAMDGFIAEAERGGRG